MQRGLDGRRIAVFAGGEGETLKTALESAGALVEVLSDGQSRTDADWHGGRYAAIVIGSGRDDELEPRIVQLVREFLLSGKPVVVAGEGLALLERAGGAREDAIVISGNVGGEGRSDVVRLLAERFEDSQVDEMSDLSFPASDPPASTPGAIGPTRGADSEAR
jgi:NAD(P)H-hydrate repair Nnr-like enzyme with NAD(P)H-hydrate dehydratase domain